MSPHIVIDPQSVRLRGIGPSTGEIWFEFGSSAFPTPHWKDFVVVILEAWMAALLRIARRSSTFERVHFMDGPYHIEIRRAAKRGLELRAVEQPNTERARANVSIDALMGDLWRAADAIIPAARALGDASVDLVRLGEALPGVRREVIKLLNRSD
jgi:hypothetical protein